MDEHLHTSTIKEDVCRNRHGGAETSIIANKKVQKSKDRELIYGYIKMAGRFGHTCDELAIMLNRMPNAISGRLTELRIAGRIIISDERRLTRTYSRARVYLTCDSHSLLLGSSINQSSLLEGS